MKQLEMLLCRIAGKFNRDDRFLERWIDFRNKFERKQADDTEPIRTSRVVTDEVRNL